MDSHGESLKCLMSSTRDETLTTNYENKKRHHRSVINDNGNGILPNAMCRKLRIVSSPQTKCELGLSCSSSAALPRARRAALSQKKNVGDLNYFTTSTTKEFRPSSSSSSTAPVTPVTPMCRSSEEMSTTFPSSSGSRLSSLCNSPVSNTHIYVSRMPMEEEGRSSLSDTEETDTPCGRDSMLRWNKKREERDSGYDCKIESHRVSKLEKSDDKIGMTSLTIGSLPTSNSSPSSSRNSDSVMEVPLAQALQQLTLIKSNDILPNPDDFDKSSSNEPSVFQLPDEFGFTSKTFLKEHKKSKDLVSVHDKYCFGEVLGEGAYGVVWGAHERMHPDTQFESCGRSVAIKKLRKEALQCATKSGEKCDIAREMAVLKTVDHPTAARLFEVFEDENSIYLVLEKCEGGELLDRIMSRDLYSEEEAKDIIRQIASALAYCHARGIVHRDIKPENILFASADRRVVKLVDFGLADDTNGIRSPWNRKGTFLYSAPELHLSGGKITPKVDTWSVGCVLYGMLSGHAPFLVNRQGNLSWRMSPMEGGAWDNVSTELKQFIESLLCIDPNLRMTAENMLQSPWLAGKSQTEVTKNPSPEAELMKKLKTHMKQMRSFQSKSLFRRMCSSILARNMEWSQTRVFYESFRRMDILNDGAITFDEWANIWKLLFDDATSEECECEKVFAAVNLSNSGSIEFTEFLAACVDLSAVEESALWSAFSYFGPKDGHVKFSALKAGVMEALVCRDACDVVVMMDEELSCMRDVCIGFHDFKCMLRQEDPCHMEYCSVHHQYANERLLCNDVHSKESSSPCPSPRHSKYSGCNSGRSSVRLPPAQCLEKSPTPNRQKKNSSVLESPVESSNRIQLPPLMLPPLTLGGVSGRYTSGSSRSLSPRITTRTSPCSSRNATCKMARSVASIRRICTSPKFHLDVSPEPTPCSKDDSNSTWASVAAVSA